MQRGLAFPCQDWPAEIAGGGVSLSEILIVMIDVDPVPDLVSSASPYPLHLNVPYHCSPVTTLTPVPMETEHEHVGCSERA